VEGKGGVGDGVLGDVRSSAKEGLTHVGGDDRQPLGIGRGAWGSATVSGG
jgi:hypothetical protein